MIVIKEYKTDFILPVLLRNLWIACVVVIILEMIFMMQSIVGFIENSSETIITTISKNIETQLSVTWKLGEALSKDLILTDTTIELQERVRYLKSYAETYELFLIGLTDEEGNISSTFRDKLGTIEDRGYFQHTIKTGEAVITDAFMAEVDNKIFNYTMCIPYYDQTTTPAGTIIMSIPFADINEMLIYPTDSRDVEISLLGRKNTIMTGGESELEGVSIFEMIDESSYLSKEAQEIKEMIETKKRGSFWTIYNQRSLYISHMAVEYAPWTIIVATDIMDSAQAIIAASLVKSLLIILVFGTMYLVGKRYHDAKMAGTKEMVRRFETLQEKLKEEKILGIDTIEEFVELSKSGLLDSLTNLPTRLSIKKMIILQLKQVTFSQKGVLLIIDLDDLKIINDTYGHPAGDRAITMLGEMLRKWAKEFDCIVGRFGGDEFIACFISEEYENVVAKLIEQLRLELNEAGETLSLHASVGAAVFPNCGTEFEELYNVADKALYVSKRNGKNSYTIDDSTCH